MVQFQHSITEVNTMTTTVRHNKFVAPNFSIGRYQRREYKIFDANLHHGDVRPFACPEIVCEGLPDYNLLYPLPDCECLGFGEDVSSVVEGFCHNQYFAVVNGSLTQATTDTLCDGNVDCLAGSPFQPNPPIVEGTCDPDACDGNAVAYVVTYVTMHNGMYVESAPSPVSDVVAITGNVPNVQVTWDIAPQGYCIARTRLYRVETTYQDGSDIQPIVEGTEYVLVAEFEGTDTHTFFDDLSSTETGQPLLTYAPMPFPAPQGELVGVARTDDGIVVADKHRVYISEVGVPMFTLDGVVEVEDEIRAIRTIGNTIFVFTNHRPVKIGFRHTENTMSIERQIIQRDLPLVSEKSLSVWGTKVYFASTYSLYEWDIGGYGSDIKTTMSKMMTPEQWKNCVPESVRGTAYEYGYMFACDGLEYAIMVEYGGDGTDTLSDFHTMPITYGKADVYNTTNDGIITWQRDGVIYHWDWRRNPCGQFDIWDNVRPNLCEQCECCPWHIAFYFDNEGKNRFTKMRVEFDEQSYFDGIDATFVQNAFGRQRVVLGEAKIINSRGFSIPRYVSSQTFSVELKSCAIMHEVRFATSNQELTVSSNAVAQ